MYISFENHFPPPPIFQSFFSQGHTFFKFIKCFSSISVTILMKFFLQVQTYIFPQTYNILNHILSTFTSRKYMIFFPPGKILFFPRKGFAYFPVWAKNHLFLSFFLFPSLFPFFSFPFFIFPSFPLFPLYPSLFLFFLRLLIIIFPNPSKANIFAPPPNRKIYTPVHYKTWIGKI